MKKSVFKILEDIAKITPPTIDLPEMNLIDDNLELIDPENTFMGEIKKEIIEQNSLLKENYVKLKETNEILNSAHKDYQEVLISSNKYNKRMMTITFFAMIAAIASPIITVVLFII